jgi:hypothetical protein
MFPISMPQPKGHLSRYIPENSILHLGCKLGGKLMSQRQKQERLGRDHYGINTWLSPRVEVEGIKTTKSKHNKSQNSRKRKNEGWQGLSGNYGSKTGSMRDPH